MTHHHIIIALLACLLSGCQTTEQTIEGTYYPGCIAYTGDKISLNDGEFVWDKFTDAVAVDDDGNVINKYPDYPKRGTYRADGQVLQMNFEGSESVERLYMHKHDGQSMLLTEAQVASWEKTSHYDNCIMTLEADETG